MEGKKKAQKDMVEMRCSTEEEGESLIITTRPRVAQLHSLGLARRRKSNRREVEEEEKKTIENEPYERKRKREEYRHGL